MARNKWYTAVTRTIVAAAMSALLLAVAPSSLWAMPANQSSGDMDRLRALSGQEFEIAFMNMMIQHHSMALDMAMLVPDRAVNQELKDMAQQMIADQTREINELTGWLQQWYGVAPDQGMMMGDMEGMSMSDMMMLESLTGEEFEKQFMTMMRMHHMSAIEMAELVPGRATHAELNTLAQNIIRTQTAEIQEFESWLMAWYNVDVAGGAMSGGAPGMPRTGSGQELLGLLLLALGGVALGTLLVGGSVLRTRRR